MFKIIVTKNEIDILKIEKYCTKKYYELNKIEDKYTIEEIQKYINFFSYKSEEQKIGLILKGNDLSVILQNKLLKVLEETKPNETHIMFVNSLNGVLDTIKSRALIINENNNFEFNPTNKLEIFFKDIINTESELSYFHSNDEFFRRMYHVCEAIFRGEINVAIIKSASIDFDKEKIGFLFKWIENFLYNKNEIDRAIQVFNLEKRINFQVNYNLLATDVISSINLRR